MQFILLCYLVFMFLHVSLWRRNACLSCLLSCHYDTNPNILCYVHMWMKYDHQSPRPYFLKGTTHYQHTFPHLFSRLVPLPITPKSSKGPFKKPLWSRFPFWDMSREVTDRRGCSVLYSRGVALIHSSKILIISPWEYLFRPKCELDQFVINIVPPCRC